MDLVAVTSSPRRMLVPHATCGLAALVFAAASFSAPPALDSARYAPPDADLVLRVARPMEVWSRLAESPLGPMLADRAGGSELSESWRRFAREQGEEASALAQELLPSDATWIARLAATGDGEEWVLLTELPPEARRRILARWRPRPLGQGLFELPREGLWIADTTRHLVIAGRTSRPLLDAVLARLDGPAALPTLRDAWELDGRDAIRRGQIEAYLDRRPWTEEGLFAIASIERGLVVADLRAARADRNAPANRTAAALDPPLVAFASDLQADHLVVIATTAGLALPFGQEWLAALPEAAPAPALGAAAGPRRLWVMGETCGAANDADRDLPTPAIAVAIEVRDPDQAEIRLANWGRSLAAGVNRRFPTLVDPPLEASSTADGGSIDLRGLASSRLGDHPIARRLQLEWSVTNGPRGSWAVIASGPAWLRSVQGAFETPLGAASGEAHARARQELDAAARELETAVERGWLHGERIGRHFERWAAEADRFTSPPDREAFAERWRRVSEIAKALGEVEWTVLRSPSGSTRTAIRIGEPARANDQATRPPAITPVPPSAAD